MALDGLHASLQDALTAVGEVERELSEDDARLLGDIEARIDFGVGRAAQTVEAIAPMSAVNEVEGQIQAASAKLRAFQGSGTHQELIDANRSLDLAVRALMQVPTTGESEIVSLAQPLKRAKKAADEVIKQVRSDSEQVTNVALKEARQQLAQLQSELDGLKEAIATEKTRLDTAIATYEEQFRNGQDTRATEFTQAVEARREQFAEVVSESEAKLSQFIERSRLNLEERTEEAAGLIEAISERNEKAEELVKAIARTGMAGGYQREANNQRRALWIAYAVILIGGVVAAFLTNSALNHALKPEAGGIDFAVWIARFAVTVPLLLVLGYAIREANRFAGRERRLRNTQLHFASLEPYLENIERDDIRIALRTALIPRFFSETPLSEADLGTELGSNPVLEKVIEQLEANG